jgi:hypothetical protein
LLSIEIKATKISENSVRTPDYGNVRIAFEATKAIMYTLSIPRMAEIDKAIDELQNNLGNCYHAYMYLDSNNNNPIFKILSKEKCDPSCSILCLRQHVSVYRPKIINKIQNKSYQSENYPEHTLILDFRASQFDAISLSKEISAILRDIEG